MRFLRLCWVATYSRLFDSKPWELLSHVITVHSSAHEHIRRCSSRKPTVREASMEEFSQDLSVALEEANQQDSDSCTEQVIIQRDQHSFSEILSSIGSPSIRSHILSYPVYNIQVMQKPRRPRRRRPRKDVNIASPVSRSEGGSPERPRRAKRPPRMQVYRIIQSVL